MSAGSGASHPGSFIDISVPVHAPTPAWPGDTPFSCRWTWAMARGDSVNVSVLTSSPHVGTHADAPLHVDPAWPGTDAFDLGAFSGPATVVDVSGRDGALGLDALASEPGAISGGRLLLRTGRSIADGTFPELWPWLDPAVVGVLLGAGLRLLGVDAPSVDARESGTLEVHHALFAGGASIVENLDLRSVTPGHYELHAFPMRYVGLDAAPVRAVLRRLEPR